MQPEQYGIQTTTFAGKQQRIQMGYDRLAEVYDRRWHWYLSASTAATWRCLPTTTTPGTSALDLGCGTGLFLLELQRYWPEARLTGIDLSSAMLAQARQRLPNTIHLQQASIDNLPFPDHHFDWIISHSVFHYILKPEIALAEVRRVLRPGGQLLLTDWCRDFFWMRLLDWWLPWVDPAHTFTYSSQQIQRMLQPAGFQIIHIEKYKINWHWGLMTVQTQLI